MAQSRLSAQKDVVLVERAEVERVLDEQKLWRCGLSDSAQALAAGKLLGVELFAALETFSGNNEALGLVVFDAKTGVRLWDAALVSRGVEQRAEGIVSGIREARRKQGKVEGLRTVCLMTVRNADLPRDLDSLCDAVGVLLERELIASPDLAVLERKRLEHVNREDSLLTRTQADVLLASLVTMELEVGRSEGGGLYGTAILTDEQGKSIAKPAASVRDRNVGELSHALFLELIKSLQANPGSGLADRAKEAQRFSAETYFSWQHKDYPHALQAAESACALDPTDPWLQLALVKALTTRASGLLSPGTEEMAGKVKLEVAPETAMQSLRLANRAMDVLLALRRFLIGKIADRSAVAQLTPLWDSAERCLSIYVEKLVGGDPRLKPGLDKLLPEAREPIRAIRAKWRTYYLEIREEPLYEAAKQDWAFEWYTYFLWGILRDVEFWADSAQWHADVAHVMTRWLERVGQRDLSRSWRSRVLLRSLAVESGSRWTLNERDYALRADLWAKMDRHPDLTVRLYAQLGQLADELDRANVSKAQRQKRARECRLKLQDVIANSEKQGTDSGRLPLYAAALDATRLCDDPRMMISQSQQEELAELVAFMVSRNEVVPELVQRLGELTPDGFRAEEWNCKACSVSERLLKLLDAPNCTLLTSTESSSDRTHLRAQAQKQRDEYCRLCPGPQEPGPWKDVRELVELRNAREEIHELLLPIVAGDSVFALGTAQRAPNQFLQLLRWSLTDGRKTSLGKLAVNAPDRDFLQGKDACLCEGSYYAALKRGICAFPIGGRAAERIHTATGLPSDEILSLACLDGKLYAGTSDGFLLSYDPKSRRCDVLVSSRRKEPRSPFDDKPPASVPCLVADPERHRVVFLACLPVVKTEPGVIADQPLSGIWEYDATKREFRQLVKAPIRPSSFQWASKPRENKFLLATDQGTIAFDLGSNRAELLYAGRILGRPALGAAKNSLQNSSRLTNGSLELSPPYMVLEGWLWSAKPFGRVSLNGLTQQSFPYLRQMPSFPKFERVRFFEVVGNGSQVLIGDRFGLWLLNMHKD